MLKAMQSLPGWDILTTGMAALVLSGGLQVGEAISEGDG
jgi:hypothetical protein